MRIGINITNLYPGKIGGAEQYVRNVIREMGIIGKDLLYVMVNTEALPTFKETEFIKICHVKIEEERDAQMNFYIDYYNIEIVFAPLFYLAPCPCKVPSIVSILDIQHEYFPQYFNPLVLYSIRKATKDTLKQADGILTISEYSQNTIIDKYRIPENKIAVTYLDSDSSFDMPLEAEKANQLRKEIGENYIFYPANTWPHKNHINLLKAYKILKTKYHIKNKLVFTGDSKHQKRKIEKYINSNHLTEDIKYLGYQSQENMPYIFSNAVIMVFPSIFEGFGIPLVEAMKAGVAIACSKCGSIPEIAGEAAIYFDAYDPQDIAEKVYELLSNRKLRNDIIEKGKIVVQKYSWEKCAVETRGYLEKVLGTVDKKGNSVYISEMPLVSVITPSYNQGRFIRDTINSVLAQDYPKIEYIVVDGGSTDETIDILSSYGDKLKWVSEKDKGQADAINKGIYMAHGQIIGWLNSDDTYLEGAISKAVTYLKSHPNTDVVYGEGYYTDVDGKIRGRYATKKFSIDELAQQCIICQPTAFFTKTVAEKVGMIDDTLQLCMDYEFWIRISRQGKIAYIPEYLATSRMYEDNKTLSRRKEVYLEACKVVKKYYGYVPVGWIIGYAYYLSNDTHGIAFWTRSIMFFLKYNWKQWRYCRSIMIYALKKKLLEILRLLEVQK